MVLQAFMDDSRTDGGVFVLAGWIAPAEKWVQFARDWEELLPGTGKGLNGAHRFKMSEMARTERGRELAGAFYRVIESINPVGLCVKLHIGELRRAISRIWSLNGPLNFGHLKNPYLLSFFFLLHSFHSDEREALREFLPDGGAIDFIFDDQSEKSVILGAWDRFLERLDPKRRQMYGTTPRFENDEKFLPLQAADLLAWCLRKWYENGHNHLDAINLNFTEWFKTNRELNTFNLELTEDIIAQQLIEMLRVEVDPSGYGK